MNNIKWTVNLSWIPSENFSLLTSSSYFFPFLLLILSYEKSWIKRLLYEKEQSIEVAKGKMIFFITLLHEKRSSSSGWSSSTEQFQFSFKDHIKTYISIYMEKDASFLSSVSRTLFQTKFWKLIHSFFSVYSLVRLSFFHVASWDSEETWTAFSS